MTNNDTEGCSAVDYSISANALSGWSTTESTVNLEPGASNTATVNVTSPETADAGVYDVTFTAMNNAQSEYKNSTNSSYIVETLVEECVWRVHFCLYHKVKVVMLSTEVQSFIPRPLLAKIAAAVRQLTSKWLLMFLMVGVVKVV
ncbi:NEW3 domain-containing protein [Vibrio sp. M60_M31a]